MSRRTQKRALNIAVINESVHMAGHHATDDIQELPNDGTYAYVSATCIEACTGEIRCELTLDKYNSSFGAEQFSMFLDEAQKQDIVDTIAEYARTQAERMLNHVADEMVGADDPETSLVIDAAWAERRVPEHTRAVRPRVHHFSRRTQYRQVARGLNILHPIQGLDMGNNGGQSVGEADPRHPSNSRYMGEPRRRPLVDSFAEIPPQPAEPASLPERTSVMLRAMTEQERRDFMANIRESSHGAVIALDEAPLSQQVRTLPNRTTAPSARPHSTERSRRIARENDDD